MLYYVVLPNKKECSVPSNIFFYLFALFFVLFSMDAAVVKGGVTSNVHHLAVLVVHQSR